MPLICSSCGAVKPYGDFVQISYKADPRGYRRGIQQRANGVHITDWQSLEAEYESDSEQEEGIFALKMEVP